MSDFEGPELQALLQKGQEKGWLTYEQANQWLGEDTPPAEDIDRFLQLLVERGIELIDEREAAEPGPVSEEKAAATLDLSSLPARPEHQLVGDPAMHAAFLSDICEHPDDDAPRLIYADWLDEQGSAWGEFIRVQCALARLDEDDSRYADLKNRERELEEIGWAVPFQLPSIPIENHRRGMIEHARMLISNFLEHAEEVFRQTPVHSLQLIAPSSRFSPDDMALVMARPELRRLVELNLSGCGLWREHVEVLLGGPPLPSLATLRLRENPCLPAAAEMLARTGALHGLTSLDLGDCGAGDDHVRVLLASPLASRLRELRVDEEDPEHVRLSEDGIRTIAATPLPLLRTLDLGGARLSAGAVAALAHSPNLPALVDINLNAWCRGDPYATIVDGVAEALADSALAARVESLGLFRRLYGAERFAPLTRTDLPRLKKLILSGNDLGEEGLRLLLTAPWAAHVRELELSGNALTPDALHLLERADVLPCLRRLELGEFEFDREAVQVLALSPLLGRLSELSLSGIRVGLDDVRALLSSPHLSPRLLLRLNAEWRQWNAITALANEGGRRRCWVRFW